MSGAESKLQSEGYEESWIRMVARLYKKKRLPPGYVEDVFEKVVDLSENMEATWVDGSQAYTGEFILEYANTFCADEQRPRVARLLERMGQTSPGIYHLHEFIQGLRHELVFKELSSTNIPVEGAYDIEWELDFRHEEPEEKEGRLFRWIVLKVGPSSRVKLLYCGSSEIERKTVKEDAGPKSEEVLQGQSSSVGQFSDSQIREHILQRGSEMMMERQEGRAESDDLASWVHGKLIEHEGTLLETKYLGSQWMKDGMGETTAKKISMSNGCKNFGEFIDEFVTKLAVKEGSTIHCHGRNTVQQRFGINIESSVQEDLDKRIKSWLIKDRGVPIGDPKTAALIFTQICVELRYVEQDLERENRDIGFELFRIEPERRIKIQNDVVDSLVPEFGEKHKGFIWRSSLSPLHSIIKRRRISGFNALRDNCNHFIEKASEHFDYDSVWDVVMDWRREVEENLPESEQMLHPTSFNSWFEPTSRKKMSYGNRKKRTKKFRTVRGGPKRNTGGSISRPEVELDEE